MGLMPYRSGRAAARGIDPLLMGMGDPAEPSLLARAISAPLKLGGHLLSPLLVPGDLTRALIGLMRGQELSDEGVYGIPTVSGERLLEGIWDLPPNVQGKAEWRDVPGFATELLADPLFFAPFGGLTKLGQAGKQASKVLKAAKQTARTKGRSAADIMAMVREGRGILGKAGVEGAEGMQVGALRAEAGALAKGGRQFLGFQPPFMHARPILPTGLNRRLVEGTRAALRGAGRARELPGVGRALEYAGSRLRRPGVESEATLARQVRGGKTVFGAADTADLQRIAHTPETGIATYEGREAAFHIDSYLRKVDAGETEPALARLRETTDAALETAYMTDRKALELKEQITRYAGDPEKVAKYQQQLDHRRMTFATKGALLPKTPYAQRRGDWHAFLALSSALEQGSRTEKQIADWGVQALEKNANALRAVGGTAALPGSPAAKALAKVEARNLQRLQRLQDRIAPLLMRTEVSEDFVRYMEHAMPDMLMEAKRLQATFGRRIGRELATGQTVSELADPYQAYMHRMVSDAGQNVLQIARGKHLRGTVISRYAKVFGTKPGFAMQRIPELNGMTVPVANDLLRADLHRGFELAAVSQGITGKAGIEAFANKMMKRTLGDGTFFVEDPAEIALRRITASGMATEMSLFTRGAIMMSHFPKDMAQKGDVSIEKALKAVRVGDVGGTVGLDPTDIVRGRDARGLAEKQIREMLAGTSLEGHYVPGQVYNWLTKLSDTVNSPEKMSGFFNFVNKWNAMLRFHVTASALPAPLASRLGVVGRGLSGGMLGGALGGAIGGVPGAAVGAGIGVATGAIAGVVPLFPGFHVRNLHTNLFMMWLRHDFGPQHLGVVYTAGRLQKHAGEALRLGGNASKEQASALKLLHRAEALDVLGRTYVTETAEHLGRPGGATRAGKLGGALDYLRKPGSTDAGQQAMRVNQEIENTSKLALWLHLRKKLGSDILAADEVKKTLFDYSDLSQWEKQTVRKAAFFYTFTRKAIPLMMESILTNPRKMRGIALAGGMGTASAQKAFFTEYEQQRMPFAAPGFFDRFRNADGSRMFFDFDFPPKLLNIFDPEGRTGLAAWKRSLGKLGAQFAPPLRMPYELMFGRSMQSGRPQPMLETILGASPAARLTNVLKRHGITEPRRYPSRGPVELLRELGVSPMFKHPEEAQARKRLEAVTNALQGEVAAGRARPFEIFHATTGDPQKQARIKMLLKEQSLNRRKIWDFQDRLGR